MDMSKNMNTYLRDSELSRENINIFRDCVMWDQILKLVDIYFYKANMNRRKKYANFLDFVIKP